MCNRFLLSTLLMFAAVRAGAAGPPAQPEWPQFRGPEGQGHANACDLPLSWSDKENIAWKVELPGQGWSSPVITGKHIWLTTAIHDKPSLRALCIERAAGKIVQDVEVFAPKSLPQRHPKNGFATPTPILEGERVYVHFGQMGTARLGADGKILWTAALAHNLYYGPSSTPVLFEDLLIVPCQGTDVRYIAALDKNTGKERWKTTMGGNYNSDATPLIIRVGDTYQLICNLTSYVTSLDPKTGVKIWSVANGNVAQVPRPIFGHGMIYACGGYFNPVLQAIRPDGKGDVTKTHVAWTAKKHVPQNPSPLLVGDELYMVNDKGIATCLDAKTGKEHWSERLDGEFSASPLLADGRIYVTNEEGVTIVLAPGVTFKTLATNKLDGRTFASLAAVDREIYLRSERHLYRIEKK